MHRASSCQGHAARRGAAIVELAVLLPFLTFLFVAMLDHARVLPTSLPISRLVSIRDTSWLGCGPPSPPLVVTGRGSLRISHA